MKPSDDTALAEKIIGDCSVPIKEFPRQDALFDARGALWERGGACPMAAETHRIFAIFEWNGADDMAIYGVPSIDIFPEDGFKRWVIPRKPVQGPKGPVLTATVASMTLETFEAAIADELWDAWEAATAGKVAREQNLELRAALELIAIGKVRVGSDDQPVAPGEPGAAQLRGFAATILQDTAAAGGGGDDPDPKE